MIEKRRPNKSLEKMLRHKHTHTHIHTYTHTHTHTHTHFQTDIPITVATKDKIFQREHHSL